MCHSFVELGAFQNSCSKWGAHSIPHMLHWAHSRKELTRRAGISEIVNYVLVESTVAHCSVWSSRTKKGSEKSSQQKLSPLFPCVLSLLWEGLMDTEEKSKCSCPDFFFFLQMPSHPIILCGCLPHTMF